MILPFAHRGSFRGAESKAKRNIVMRSKKVFASIDRADIVRMCILWMCVCGGYVVGYAERPPTRDVASIRDMHVAPVSASGKVCGASVRDTVDAFTELLQVDRTRAKQFLDDEFAVQLHTSGDTGNVALLHGPEGFDQLADWWSNQLKDAGAVSINRRKVLHQHLDSTSKMWINDVVWELQDGITPSGTETYLLTPGNCIVRMFAFMDARQPLDLPGDDIYFTLKMLEDE